MTAVRTYEANARVMRVAVDLEGETLDALASPKQRFGIKI